MKQKFLKDLGIDIDDTTDDVLKQFDLNGFMDQISDNRLNDEKKQFDEIVAINIKYLKIFSNYTVIPHDSLAITVKETYKEIKQMIEIAENDKNT